MKRIPSLDGFRAISIFLVILAHCGLSKGFPKGYTDLVRHGAVGVTVFFVISGFLITTLLLKTEAKYGTINLKDFYIKRALRLLPVLVLYILFVSIWNNFEDLSLSTTDIIHSLTFTVNFAEKRGTWYIGHLWTLSVEEQFYLTWPLLIIYVKRKRKLMLLLFIAYSCLCAVIQFKFHHYYLLFLTPYFLPVAAIMIGAYGAITLFENPLLLDKKAFNSTPLQILALSIIIFFTYCSGYGKFALIALPFGYCIISTAILYLIFSYIKPSDRFFYKLLNHKIAVHIGVLSYSLYIWQQFFIMGQFNWLIRVFPYNIIVIYIAALASYYLWEKPFLNLKNKLNKDKPVTTLETVN